MADPLSTNDILNAYALGFFPMADDAGSDEIHWYHPEHRGQLSIDSLHVPARLAKTVIRFPYDVAVDTDFEGVIDGCAAATSKRPHTWINSQIRQMFVELHRAGYAHSVECRQAGRLVGGLYGLALGGAFFGESMFSKAQDSSKIALVHLCARLWRGGFTVLDTQFVNDHLKQFGVFTLPRDAYLARLLTALPALADFRRESIEIQGEADRVAAYLLHLKSQNT